MKDEVIIEILMNIIQISFMKYWDMLKKGL